MIILNDVSKKFGTGVFALSEVSFSINRGEFVFLVGATGSGKTTIFKLLIKDILPTNGAIVINNLDVNKLPKNKLSTLRKKIGVIFQDLKLLFDSTVFENVYLPLDVAGIKHDEAVKIVNDALEQVGLTEHKNKFPIQLSGGELQRVAVARALALSPEIILADEPTGNLDPETSWEIVKILSEINKNGTTVIMATHNLDIVKHLGKRVIHLDKGKIIKDEKGKKEEEKKEEKPKEKLEEKEEEKQDIKLEEKKEVEEIKEEEKKEKKEEDKK